MECNHGTWNVTTEHGTEALISALAFCPVRRSVAEITGVIEAAGSRRCGYRWLLLLIFSSLFRFDERGGAVVRSALETGTGTCAKTQ